jgi:hypothetical protein
MTQSDSTSNSSAPQGVSEGLLQRIVVALEGKRGRSRSEILLAIILSLSTLGSTWCGYQAGRWGGAQSGASSKADTAERVAAESTIVALQTRTFDGMALLEFWRALRTGDQKTADTLLAHMRPALQAAIKASIADGILTDPTKPGPLQRAEYHLPQESEALARRQEAATLQATANQAGQASSRYVLLTLMFASVLFFGGIGSTFSTPAIRKVLVAVAVIICLTTFFMLWQLPVLIG